jgi:glycosyltransferase involved in cell wall biosynthesis
LNIVHTVPSIALKHGGPPRSVTQLCANFKEFGNTVSLISYNYKSDTNIKVADSVKLKLVSPDEKLTTGLKPLDGQKDNSLIHHHGIWLKCAHDVIQYAYKNQIPLILSPRGMLEPWALRHNGLKKKLAWFLYQKKDLMKVTAFHATSIDEAIQIRNLGFKQPICVIPNGVNMPDINISDSWEKKLSSKRKNILFLSRLHEKKGLDILLKAWKRLSPLNAKLKIIGNDDGGYKSKLIKLKNELGISSNEVEIHEPQYGDEKNKAFMDADLFVLPSYSENFGIVVAEALSFGIPVITTKGCPWHDLETYNCGWWTDPNLNSFSSALAEALLLSKSDLYNMGKRGVKLVEEKYQWESIATQMLEFYSYVLNNKGNPDILWKKN